MISCIQYIHVGRTQSVWLFLLICGEEEKYELDEKVFVYILKVSQPFYFHILAGAGKTCIAICYSII